MLIILLRLDGLTLGVVRRRRLSRQVLRRIRKSASLNSQRRRSPVGHGSYQNGSYSSWARTYRTPQFAALVTRRVKDQIARFYVLRPCGRSGVRRFLQRHLGLSGLRERRGERLTVHRLLQTSMFVVEVARRQCRVIFSLSRLIYSPAPRSRPRCVLSRGRTCSEQLPTP